MMHASDQGPDGKARGMSHVLRERWFCSNCQQQGELDRHGRCATCGSDAVVSEQATGLCRKIHEEQELERMFRMEAR